MAEWMPDVEHIESRARGGAIEPRGVMSHIMQGSQATMIRWAEERGAITPISSHFTIGKDGRVAQHVAIRTQAWHAGRLDAGRPPTWRLLPPGGSPNDFAVGIEHEGFSGEPWPEPQIAATLRVHRWLFEELGLIPSADTVIGHFMTAPASRAHDPGSGWPRDRILEALHAQHATAQHATAQHSTAQRAAAERAAAELVAEERLVATGAGAGDAAVDSAPVVPPPPALRLPQAEYETAALNAFFEVLGHSYSVREDELWQYIEIRRPRPRPQ